MDYPSNSLHCKKYTGLYTRSWTSSKTWPMKAVDMRRLMRTENSMVRWMSGVTLKDRRKSEELRRGLGIESVDSVVSRGMLRWFGHVERKEADDWVSKCRHLEVGGGVRKGGIGRHG